MFSTRISLFSRLFRFRRRRPANANHDAAPRPQRTPTLQSDTTHTTPARSVRRTRSMYHAPDLSPMTQSPPPTFPLTPNEQDQEEPPLFLLQSSTPEPIAGFRPQPPAKDACPLAPPSASKTPVKRRVSFQVITTIVSDADSDTRDFPGTTPSSPHCPPSVPKQSAAQAHMSTRAHEERQGQEETQPRRAMSPVAPFPEPPPAYDTLQSGSAPQPSAVLLGAQSGSQSGRSRHLSLFYPQPVRADVSRFSMPARAKVPIESRRTSVIPPASRSSTAKKEKRASRWSREMNKPETQEVLRALSGF